MFQGLHSDILKFRIWLPRDFVKDTLDAAKGERSDRPFHNFREGYRGIYGVKNVEQRILKFHNCKRVGQGGGIFILKGKGK